MFARVSVVLSLLVAQSSLAGEMRAGAARIDITPPTGHAMWGYAARRDAPSVGVRDRLQARALVVEVGKDRLALVALDLGRAPTRDSTEAIRTRLQKQAGIESLFLVASHTHHGPVLEIDTWPTPKTSYVRELEKKLGDVVLEAVRGLRPARFGVGNRETTLNRNRHSKRADAPVDRLLQVLRVEGDDGKVIAHAVNFAAHPTMLPVKDMRFSADYVGVFCAAVEKETGAPCLFLQGASGDLSPNPTGGDRGPEAFGARLAKETLGVIQGIRCRKPVSERIRTHQETLRFTPRVDLKNPLWRISMGMAFYPAFIAFYEREYRDGVKPSLAVALLEDDVGIVGVSGEVFASHALQLRRRARMEHLFFVGYCNDYHQYFPTIEAVSEGGYGTEVYIGTAEIGAGERIMDRALLALYRLRGKLK